MVLILLVSGESDFVHNQTDCNKHTVCGYPDIGGLHIIVHTVQYSTVQYMRSAELRRASNLYVVYKVYRLLRYYSSLFFFDKVFSRQKKKKNKSVLFQYAIQRQTTTVNKTKKESMCTSSP